MSVQSASRPARGTPPLTWTSLDKQVTPSVTADPSLCSSWAALGMKAGYWEAHVSVGSGSACPLPRPGSDRRRRCRSP